MKHVAKLVSLVCILVAAPVAAQDSSVRGSVRAGMEYDDNAFRTEGEGVVEDFLARYFTALTLASRVMTRGAVVADIKHGGKFFVEEGDADTLLTQVYLSYQHRLTKPFGTYVAVDLKDRTERLSVRDYNRGGIGAGFDFYLGPVSIRTGGALRYFAFKPNPESSSSNYEGSFRLQWDLNDSFDTSVGYTYASRAFDTVRFELDESTNRIFEDPSEERSDAFHVATAGVGFRGPVVVEFLYSLLINRSNSYGQNLIRHSGEVTVTAPLPAQFFVSAHIELQRTRYDDPVLLDASFQVDEDNRNGLVLSLARTFGESWEVEARYSLYLQEFGVGSNYRRQTFLSAIAYLFE